MKKSIIITLCLIISMLSTSVVFAMDNETIKAETEDEEIINVDMNSLDLSKSKKIEWDEVLVNALKKSAKSSSVTPENLKQKNEEMDKIISDYCSAHYDEISGAIYDKALSAADGNNISINLNENSEEYKKYVNHYDIDDSTSITITPDSIYVDEYAEKDISNPTTISSSAKASTSWKYKDVATRRTLYYKATVNQKTYSFKIYSAHTGGQVKYNGSIAKHNASYYAYNLAEAYGSPFTFKQIAKQSEQYSGTSWHYKYLGKVTGSISITTPVKLKIQFKEKALGCQVITNKNGSVTKNYWPSL